MLIDMLWDFCCVIWSIAGILSGLVAVGILVLCVAVMIRGALK